MKSEKAKELIEKYAVGNSRDAAPHMMKHRVIECVELAEREAEGRMREKAIKAYCHDCSCTVRGICEISADNCLALQGFIQKLNEE